MGNGNGMIENDFNGLYTFIHDHISFNRPVWAKNIYDATTENIKYSGSAWVINAKNGDMLSFDTDSYYPPESETMSAQWIHSGLSNVFNVQIKCIDSFAPSAAPTHSPTRAPSFTPTSDPTLELTTDPTFEPTFDPTIDPTADPSTDPTVNPTLEPTMVPTNVPSISPTNEPTYVPTYNPTSIPTVIIDQGRAIVNNEGQAMTMLIVIVSGF